MKHQIEVSFNKQMRENPIHSSYVNFCRAIRGRNFSQFATFKYFKKLVHKDDYGAADREELLMRNVYPLLAGWQAPKTPYVPTVQK